MLAVGSDRKPVPLKGWASLTGSNDWDTLTPPRFCQEPRLSSAFDFRTRRFLLHVVLLSAWLGIAPVCAGVFGDPRGEGLVEDDRVPLGSDEWQHAGLGDWSLSSGTIHCDGRQRGSAIILSTEGLGPAPEGLVLATAAHVFYDLDTGDRFNACSFHYMGLSQLPGYRADIDMSSASLGGFRPGSSLESADFGQGDWAFLHVPGGVLAADHAKRLKPVAWEQVLEHPSGELSAQLLAWSIEHSAISVSRSCTVVHSHVGDLGGGVWPGQLLDDCDSGQGASGGGLLVTINEETVLLGIRTGSHWDPKTYPSEQFPNGPPPGARWDRETYTNFARAIDRNLLDKLNQFLRLLARDTL